MALKGFVEAVSALKSMTTSLMRSNPLHNLTLPLPFLNWGTKRRMSCMNATDSAVVSSSGNQRSSASKVEDSMVTQKNELESEKNVWGSKRQRSGKNEDGIAEVRQKLMLDLKNEADRLKDEILGNEEEPVRPWNLRTRQRQCKTSVAAGVNTEGLEIHDDGDNFGVMKLPKLRINTDKLNRVKLHVELSKKEIEDDFMEMLGKSPPRRPNKRPKSVQKQLDVAYDLFPGLWLKDVTADKYKVVEANKNGKVLPSVKGKGKGKGKGRGNGKGKGKGKDQ